MKVRTRLVLAFSYILFVLIVALGLPLTINLRERAVAELENSALITTQGIAAAVDPNRLDQTEELQAFVTEQADRVDARVLVLGPQGRVLADAGGPTAAIGENYRTPGRPEIVGALDDGLSTSEIRASEDLGRDIMATAVPLLDDGGNLVGAVRITQDVQQASDNVQRVTLGLLAIGGAALVAGLVLAFGLAASLSRPLSRLAGTARRLGRGDLSARTEQVGGASEIEEVGRSFDEMADRLERSVQAQRAFVANASHQLRTPLTGMKLQLESAIAEAPDADTRRRLEAADREVDRLAGIVDRLLETSREIEEGTPGRMDLAEVVERARTRWTERAAQRGATLTVAGDGGIGRASAEDLDQILDNLLDNATTYAPGEITIASGSREGQVFVAVEDHGPGIPPDEVPRVTERFYRGRDAPAGGSGLGLAIARELAERWGGTVVVTGGDGTRVEVRLPPA